MAEAKTNGTTELVFLLDGVGAMAEPESNTIDGFNRMIARLREEGTDVIVSTDLFGEYCMVAHNRMPITEVPALTSMECYMRDGRALIDSIGGVILRICREHTNVCPEDRPARTMFVIITDGMENASLYWAHDKVREMVAQQQGAGWVFIFLGANIDALQVAGDIGISAENAAQFACDAAGVRENFASLTQMILEFSATGVVAPTWSRKISEHLAKTQSGRS